MKQEGISPLPNQQELFKSFKSVRALSFLISLTTICVCFLGLGAFNQTLATNYYVDSSITDTFPANATPDCANYNTATFACSGGSESAYKTIADINAGSFSGDDQILFRKGQTWREQLTVPSSGTSGHPITFGAFGSGNKPIVNGSDLITGWTNYSGNVWEATVTTEPKVVWFNGTHGILETAIGNINAQYEWYWTGNILYVYSTSDPDSAYTNPGIEALSRTNAISDYQSYVTFSNLNFVNNGNSNAALVIGSGSSETIVDSCNFSQTGESHIGIWGTAKGNVTIQNNTFSYSGLQHVLGAGSAIDVTRSTEATSLLVTVQNSTFTHVGDYTGSGYHDHGIYFKSGRLIWRYNYQYNGGVESGASVKISGNAQNGCEVYYNIISSDGGIQPWGVLSEAGSDHKIYNNVFYGVGTGVWAYTGGSGITIKNNIFYTTTYRFLIATVTTNFISDNNIFYNGSATPFDWGGTVSNLTDWKTNSGQDANSINTDPYFVGGGDTKPYPYFYPRSYSPVINAGTDVGLTKDYLNVNVPQGAAADIGAFEYTVSIPENIWFFFPLFLALPRLIFLLSNRQGRRLLRNLISKREYKSVLIELYLPYLNLVYSLTKPRTNRN